MIYILLADGFEEVEALTPADYLRRAGMEVALVGVSGMTAVGGHGIRVAADIPYEALDPAALTGLIIPGGRAGAQTLYDAPRIRALAASVIDDPREGVFAAAICAGPMVFGGAKGMVGREFTCYPGFDTYLPGGVYRGDRPVVRDRQVITARSAAASAAFAFALIEAYKGGDAARAVMDAIFYEG